MIYDPLTRVLIDNQGWIDRGSLWLFDVSSKGERLLTVDGAAYLTIRAGLDGLFRVTHHNSPDQSISIRHVSEPQSVLASVSLASARNRFCGDTNLWGKVECALIFNTGSKQKLVRIEHASRSVVDLDLSWYNEGTYDLGYQGLVDCVTPPGAHFTVVSVQRSSTLVLIDRASNAKCGLIELAGRSGNPDLRMTTNSDLLASDYDTMCRVDLKKAKVVVENRLQGAAKGTMQPIGDYAWAAKETIAVARPMSGDVIFVDAENFSLVSKVRAPDQPLRVAAVEGGIVTRDWQSGQVSYTAFQF